MHGGIGVTFDHDLHLYLRRHTVNRALYGTPAEHRQRLAAHRRAAGGRRMTDSPSRTSTPSGAGRGLSLRPNLGPPVSVMSADVLRNTRTDDEELAAIAHERVVQRMFFDAGLRWHLLSS